MNTHVVVFLLFIESVLSGCMALGVVGYAVPLMAGTGAVQMINIQGADVELGEFQNKTPITDDARERLRNIRAVAVAPMEADQGRLVSFFAEYLEKTGKFREVMSAAVFRRQVMELREVYDRSSTESDRIRVIKSVGKALEADIVVMVAFRSVGRESGMWQAWNIADPKSKHRYEFKVSVIDPGNGAILWWDGLRPVVKIGTKGVSNEELFEALTPKVFERFSQILDGRPEPAKAADADGS